MPRGDGTGPYGTYDNCVPGDGGLYGRGRGRGRGRGFGGRGFGSGWGRSFLPTETVDEETALKNIKSGLEKQLESVEQRLKKVE